MPEVLEGVGGVGATAPHIMADWSTLFQLGENITPTPDFQTYGPPPPIPTNVRKFRRSC